MPPPQSPLPLPAHGSTVTILFLSLCDRSQTKTEILFSILRPYTPTTTFIHYSQLNTVLSCPVCSLIYYSFSFFHSIWNQLHKLENHPLTYYLEPASNLEIIWLSYLLYHFIISIYSIIDWLSMFIKSCVFYLILFVVSYSSIILIKLAIKIKKRWSFIVIL